MKSISQNLAMPTFQIFNCLEEDASKEKMLNIAKKFNQSIFLCKNAAGYISIVRIYGESKCGMNIPGVGGEGRR